MKRTIKLFSLFTALIVIISLSAFTQSICKTEFVNINADTTRINILKQAGEVKDLSKQAYIVIEQQKEILAKTDSAIVILEKLKTNK